MPGLRVLLVDDHEGFRAAASDMLTGGGFDLVATAASGEEALVTATSRDVDLVLVDLVLPGIDGITVATYLARLSPAPLVILISSQGDAVHDPRVRAAPALGFLAKTDLTCPAILALVG